MKKKVLLIEDDKIVRENTVEILELANYNVSTAENGKLGVEVAKVFLPDIIICDILMPVLDGYGVLQIISKTPQLKNIPFIFLTAKTHQSDLRKGMEFGADDYITKPFEESELLRAIDVRIKRVEAFEQKPKLLNTVAESQNSELKSIKNIQQFLQKKRVYTFNKGETIYCSGNMSSHLFLIKSGLVKTYRTNEYGKELNTDYFGKEQYFGYSSFVKRIPHTENSKAMEPTKLFKISRDEVTSIVNNNHHVLYSFIDLLASKQINATKKQLLLAYGSVRKKTATILLELSKKDALTTSKGVSISRINLANSVGIAKETLTRTLQDFKTEQLITLSSKGYKIVNEKELIKIS